MGPLIGQWERTPLWRQALGKPAMRRHIVWAHSDEWEYGWPSTFNGLEDALRRATATPEPVSAPATDGEVSAIKAFEAWAGPEYLLKRFEGDGAGRRYHHMWTERAWKAWCAALSNPAPGHGEGGL